jgi:hypothetical protein
VSLVLFNAAYGPDPEMLSLEFDVAKKFLENSSVRKLNAKSIEELCLSVSREFYDNASSGNLHVGDMKLAYDWYVHARNNISYLVTHSLVA